MRVDVSRAHLLGNDLGLNFSPNETLLPDQLNLFCNIVQLGVTDIAYSPRHFHNIVMNLGNWTLRDGFNSL